MSEEKQEEATKKQQGVGPAWTDVILLVIVFCSVVSQAVEGNVNAAATIAILAFIFAFEADWRRRWEAMACNAVEDSLRATTTAILMKQAYDDLKKQAERKATLQ